MMMIGTILGGFLTERIGCLWSIRISVILEICGWIATLWASTFGHLMIGRVLTGLGAGLATPAAYLVLSELSLIRYRGIFATLNSFSNNFAWLIGLVLGRFCSLNTLIYTYALPGVLFLAMSPFLPESPLWLTKRGKDEEAVKALEIIRGREYPVQVIQKFPIFKKISHFEKNCFLRSKLKNWKRALVPKLVKLKILPKRSNIT